MLPSWLSPRGDAEPSAPATHAVLGTPLMAPLMADQEEAIFACGCFWGAEKGFWRLPGVVSTAVGYAGGQIEQPSYNQVCSGRTGHTEVVRVVWSRPALDFSDLLKLFWECHDPTQGNRQGNDTGSQYRSAIYTFNPEHLQLALASRDAYQACPLSQGLWRHHHRNPCGSNLLFRRGLSPAVPRQTGQPPLLLCDANTDAAWGIRRIELQAPEAGLG
jgi:peptide-methionine (S)-S-oxide reductase